MTQAHFQISNIYKRTLYKRHPTFPVTDQRLHTGMKLPQLIIQIFKMLLLLLKPLTNTHIRSSVCGLIPSSPLSNLTFPVCFIDILIPISILPSRNL